MGVSMMSILVHTIGFVVCGTVITLGLKRLYRDSQRDLDAPFDESLPEYHYAAADAFGLGLSIGAYGVEVIESRTDRLFDSRLFQWIRSITESWQVKPDGVYIHPRFDHNEWQGYGDEKPKPRPGKFEMEI